MSEEDQEDTPSTIPLVPSEPSAVHVTITARRRRRTKAEMAEAEARGEKRRSRPPPPVRPLGPVNYELEARDQAIRELRSKLRWMWVALAAAIVSTVLAAAYGH